MLLTRPPLIREQALFTVRLACVRRAASVRPESGSNSLKFVSNRGFPRSNLYSNLYSNKQTQRFINAICLSEIIVFSHQSLELFVRETRIDKVIIRSSYCSIFKEQVPSARPLSYLSVLAALSRRLDYYITFPSACQ